MQSSSAAMQATKSWIASILREKHWTGTELARQAGVAPSTLLRFLNDPDYKFQPTLRTLSKIGMASGRDIPQQLLQTVSSRASDELRSTPERMKFDRLEPRHSRGSPHRLTLEGDRVALPAELIEEVGFLPGSKLMGRVRDGKLIIEPAESALRRAQDLVQEFVPKSVSVVDELIAERHAAADRE